MENEGKMTWRDGHKKGGWTNYKSCRPFSKLEKPFNVEDNCLKKEEKMKQRRIYVGLVFVLVVAFFVPLSGLFSGGNTALAADQPVKLKVLSSWTSEYLYVKEWLHPYIQRINQRSAGRLQISSVGPEAIPPFEQLKPLSQGLFDMLFTHPSYHIGEIAVGQGMDLVKGTPKARRAAGFMELLDEAYKKVNAKYLGMSYGIGGYHYILKKELHKADFSGLKIRATPYYDPMVRALGGVTVRVAAGEIYSALEKGVVDGAGFPVFGALDYKWYEVSKFQLRPAFGEVVDCVLVNLDSWSKLPKDLQNLIMQVTMEMEEEGYKDLTTKMKEEEDKLVGLGMKLSVLPPAEADKYIKTYYDRTWEEIVLKYSSDSGPRLKKLVDEFVKKNKQ
jgi:TRAP-type C4-dicarboxylate transport system substrate-binding protein